MNASRIFLIDLQEYNKMTLYDTFMKFKLTREQFVYIIPAGSTERARRHGSPCPSRERRPDKFPSAGCHAVTPPLVTWWYDPTMTKKIPSAFLG